MRTLITRRRRVLDQHVSNLRQFFQWAQAEGFMRHNPTLNLTLMKVQRKVRQQPSPDVLGDLLETATFPRDRALLALGMNTGLRSSEIISMTVGDVDLESGNLYATIHVQASPPASRSVRRVGDGPHHRLRPRVMASG